MSFVTLFGIGVCFGACVMCMLEFCPYTCQIEGELLKTVFNSLKRKCTCPGGKCPITEFASMLIDQAAKHFSLEFCVVFAVILRMMVLYLIILVHILPFLFLYYLYTLNIHGRIVNLFLVKIFCKVEVLLKPLNFIVGYFTRWLSFLSFPLTVMESPIILSMRLWEVPISRHNRVVFSLILLFRILGMVCRRINNMGVFLLIRGISFSYCFCILVHGLIINGFKDFSHIVPYRTPTVLVPLLCVVEGIRLIIRPVTLTVRLCANIIVGHIFLNSVFGVFFGLLTYCRCSFCPVFSTLLCWFILFPIIFWITIGILRLELGVLLIQAGVFTTLLRIYTQHG